MAKGRKRLDEILLERGLADSRTQAQGLILGGKVRTGTTVLDKPGKNFPEEIEIDVISASPYVGRGAEKLKGFLDLHPIAIEGKRILDVGASTGGFTDYLLQSGASEAVCVDVGYGQLHHRLREDPRVHNLERINARLLQSDDLPHPSYDLIVMDLSFISLTRVLPAVWPFLSPEGHLIALVKPQFEVGKEIADRYRGVIRDPQIQAEVLKDMIQFAKDNLPASELIGTCESPIAGAKGNRESLAGWKKGKREMSTT